MIQYVRMELNEIISKNLIELRKKNKLTQLELAEKLDFSNKSISKWESGEAIPNIEILMKLSSLYNVNLDYFVSETHPEDSFNTAKDNEEEKENKPEKKRISRYVYNRITITLLCISVVWIVATYMFVFAPHLMTPTYLPFLWAVPISFAMAIIFNSIWGRARDSFVYSSFLIWTLLVCLYLTLPTKFWQLFLLGVPLQIVIILLANLLLKTRKNDPDTIHEKRKHFLFKLRKKKEKQERKKLLEKQNEENIKTDKQ